MDILKRLRVKNRERQAEWPGSDKVDVGFRGLEFGGECGELQGAIKKLIRHENKIAGNKSDDIEPLLRNLREEVGDVLICLDLIASYYDLDIEACTVEKFNLTSEKVGLTTRLD